MSNVAEVIHSEWSNSGTVTKVYISYNNDGVKCLKITDITTDTVYLDKTFMVSNSYPSLETTFATSNFNANNRGIMVEYSDS
jgi:hypothetical protein